MLHLICHKYESRWLFNLQTLVLPMSQFICTPGYQEGATAIYKLTNIKMLTTLNISLVHQLFDDAQQTYLRPQICNILTKCFLEGLPS